MELIRILLSRCAALFRGRELDEDLDEELRAHIDLCVEENVKRGMSEKEARRAAMREFGGLTQARERYREQRGWSYLSDISADLRFAARQLARSPGFFAVAVLTLAVGIGATTAIFSLLESILLRPLPFARQEELVKVSGYYPKGWVRAVQQQSRSVESMLGYGVPLEHNVEGSEGPDRIFATSVTTNAFALLGLRPELGRAFLPGESEVGADEVVVLSDGYWRQRFAGDKSAIGKTLRIDGEPRTIVGVMPAGIDFPDATSRMWLPVAFKANDPVDAWAMFDYQMIGRLRKGVSAAEVQAEMRTLHPGLLRLFPWRMPDSWYADVTATALLDSVVADARPKLWLLLAGVGLVLMIACANVANLMLARAATRSREVAVRSVLGATTPRLMRQMLTEGLLLGLIAGSLGMGIAAVVLRGLKLALPPDTPRLAETEMDASALLFVLAMIVLTSLIFGLAPAWRIRTLRPQEALRGNSQTQSESRGPFRFSSMLVICQVALAVVVITCTGVMVHSLWRLIHVDPGFRADNLVTARISLDPDACAAPNQERCANFYRALLDRMRSRFSTEETALVSYLPMQGYDEGFAFDAEDHPRPARQTPDQGSSRMVSPSYFKLLGISLRRGRLFDQDDGSGQSRAAIINAKMAEHYWPGTDPIGKRVEWVGLESAQGVMDDKAFVVVGVVANTRHESLGSDSGYEMYTPMSPGFIGPEMSLMVRSSEGASSVAQGIRVVVGSLNSSAAVSDVATMNSLVAGSARSPRSLTVLLAAFALLALGVGLMGVYSLIAYVVSCRKRDLGIRLAMGAGRTQIIALVLRQGLLLAGAGCAIGLIVASMAARLLQSFLFATRAIDPAAFCLVPAVLVLLAAAAAWKPAWEAAQIEPMETLRAD